MVFKERRKAVSRRGSGVKNFRAKHAYLNTDGQNALDMA